MSEETSSPSASWDMPHIDLPHVIRDQRELENLLVAFEVGKATQKPAPLPVSDGGLDEEAERPEWICSDCGEPTCDDSLRHLGYDINQARSQQERIDLLRAFEGYVREDERQPGGLAAELLRFIEGALVDADQELRVGGTHRDAYAILTSALNTLCDELIARVAANQSTHPVSDGVREAIEKASDRLRALSRLYLTESTDTILKGFVEDVADELDAALALPVRVQGSDDD